MSPEILMGVDFSLPSDIFSLGIIFCEILSRHLVDANTFKRELPSFGIDADEVNDLASSGCPPAFIKLALDCVEEDPRDRPSMREVVRRLREIETQVILKEKEEAGAEAAMYSVGSVRGSSVHAVLGSKANNKRNRSPPAAAADQQAPQRPSMAPKMPSFSGEVDVRAARGKPSRTPSEDSSSSDDMNEAIAALEKIGINASGVGEDLMADATMPEAASAKAAAKLSSTLRRGGGKITLTETIKAGSTFKVSGHGNPWWSDEADRQTLPSINASWLKPRASVQTVKASAESEEQQSPVQPPARSSSILTARRNNGSDAEQYSTSVIRSSKMNQSHATLASTMSAMTERQVDDGSAAAGGEQENNGSTLTIKQPKGVRVGGGPSSSNFLANLDGSSPQASYMTARTHNHHHGADPSLANATIASSIHGALVHGEAEAEMPASLFHRFTLVKNGMKRPSNLTAAANAAASGIAGSAFGSLLPPAIMLTNALQKCWVCGKRIGWKPFLDCDDCPYK